ncbi:3641_t:CDS:1, partial [Paraglomus occultum]
SEENIPIAKLEDVPLALQLKPVSPVPFSSSDDDKTSSLLSTTNPGFPSFTSPTPSRPTSIGTSQDNKSQNSLFSPGSLMAEAEEKGMSTTAQVLAEKRSMLTAYKNSKNEPQEETEMTFSAGSLMAAAEEKGLFNKPSRSDLDSVYSDSCVSLKSPKRPEKRLPEIPRTTSPPSSPPLTFVSTTSTDRGRQSSSIASSCYETASGSTATLHTAPPSPTTEIDGTIVGSPTIELTIPALTERLDLNDESTPKIHVDEAILASPVESVDTVPGVPEERDEEEYRWAQARNAAKRCFDDNETFMKKEKVTEFLGRNWFVENEIRLTI